LGLENAGLVAGGGKCRNYVTGSDELNNISLLNWCDGMENITSSYRNE